MLTMGLGFMPLGSAAVHAEEQLQKSGYIVWAVHQSMPMFDIHFDTTYIPAQPVAPVYNGLVTQNPYNAGKIIGDLAERWEITEDGKRITFSLHKGVKFHDGAAFTCAAAQYSVDKLADVTVVEEVHESSSCADDFALVVSLKCPSTALMTLLSGAHATMMKKGIAEAIERKDTKFLVGMGPFRFKSYTPGVDFQADTSPSSVHMDEPDYTTRVSPGMRRPIAANTAVPSSTNSSTSRVACSMSRNGRKLPGRWSASCSTISPMIAAMTGKRPWATGIGCRIGPHFWARQCIITANLNRSGAKAAGACELCEPTFYAGLC
jgi:Bacterial extracellular solute-binding proteins, family 5 Middle